MGCLQQLVMAGELQPAEGRVGGEVAFVAVWMSPRVCWTISGAP